METSRGCAYRCSFCTEPLYGNPSFRPPESIVREVEALYETGVRHFRLGRQADMLAYGGDGEAPNPDALRALYGGHPRGSPRPRHAPPRQHQPDHDRGLAGGVAGGLEIIAEHNTPGDTAAFGLE